MNEFFENNYIHAIGEVTDELTYERLSKILNYKTLYSRKMLDELGIEHNGANKYGLEIPKGKEWMYYSQDEDIHYELVSLHDPSNHAISNAISKNISFNCFRPTKIAFAISKDVQTVPINETKGIDIGEVQVKGSISSEFITGIIIPSSKLIPIEIQQLLCEKIKEACEKRDLILPIYDYQGNILYQSDRTKK
jgi:hypothetical protein